MRTRPGSRRRRSPPGSWRKRSFPPPAGRGTLDVERLNADEDADRLPAYIEAVCGLTGDQWEDAAVIRGMGASAFEIIVLRLGDEESAGNIEAVLTDYLTVREGAFTGYAPDEAADEVQARYGITADQFEACGCVWWGPQFHEAFGDVSDTMIISRNVHEVTVFQTAAEDGARELAQALSGYKVSWLEELEQRKAYTDEAQPDFTQLTRESAQAQAQAAALAEAQVVSSGHYAALIKRTAVCLGYAASFQLLMDMSGVECITVVGAAFNSTGDHAWNMVRLNGEWYCADPTWDANAWEQFQEEREWR